MKYILIYNIDDYCDMGGGYQIEFPNDSNLLDKRVEEVMSQGHTLICAGELHEYTYKTVEVIKKVVRD